MCNGVVVKVESLSSIDDVESKLKLADNLVELLRTICMRLHGRTSKCGGLTPTRVRTIPLQEQVKALFSQIATCSSIVAECEHCCI